jgi:hypothetical protein
MKNIQHIWRKHQNIIFFGIYILIVISFALQVFFALDAVFIDVTIQTGDQIKILVEYLR